jgi:AcrR family transcriptional regulator
VSAETTAAAVDGRSTRWEAHRRARREELVGAALKAISRHGPGVGMDEIAAVAGTSKTVLYRHFADKDQLYLAVATRVDERVAGALRAAIAEADGFREGLRAAIGTYLHLVDADPAVYRFVVRRRGVERSGPPGALDPVAGLSAAVSAELARLIDRHLRAGGVSRAASAAWAHGLVGMVRAAADHWQEARGGPGVPGRCEPVELGADELADHLTDLAWGGLAPALAPHARPTAPDDADADAAAAPDEETR